MRSLILVGLVISETIMYYYFHGEIGFVCISSNSGLISSIDARWYVDLLMWYIIVIYSLYLSTTKTKRSIIILTILYYIFRMVLFVLFFNYTNAIPYVAVYVCLCIVSYVNFNRKPKWLK